MKGWVRDNGRKACEKGNVRECMRESDAQRFMLLTFIKTFIGGAARLNGRQIHRSNEAEAR